MTGFWATDADHSSYCTRPSNTREARAGFPPNAFFTVLELEANCESCEAYLILSSLLIWPVTDLYDKSAVTEIESVLSTVSLFTEEVNKVLPPISIPER